MSLTVRSRQKTHPVDAWLLRRLAKWVLEITEPDTAKRQAAMSWACFSSGRRRWRESIFPAFSTKAQPT